MPARRRRTGSESESLITVTLQNTSYTGFPNNAPPDYYLEEHVEDYVEPVMTARDRTNEFINTIQTLQGRNIARAVAVKDPRRSKVIQSHSEFMLVAKNIGKNIASTFSKLEKLTLRKLTYSPLNTVN